MKINGEKLALLQAGHCYLYLTDCQKLAEEREHFEVGKKADLSCKVTLEAGHGDVGYLREVLIVWECILSFLSLVPS